MQLSLPNLRYEKKFIAEGFTLAEVVARVRRHPAAFREAYPPRIVNNIYLDSPARRDYHDHVNGAANRTKTRVRWYGPHFETADRPMLERKFKRGMVSGKQAYPLTPLSINGRSLQASLTASFDTAAIPPMLRSTLRHLEPALLNRYRRHYFLSRDGNFRLTVDSDLQFGCVQPNNQPVVVSLLSTPKVILELKFGLEFAEAADFVTNTFPLRVARFSKYVAGIERI